MCKRLIIICGIIIFFSSCLEDYYNSLKYCYANFDNLKSGSSDIDYKDFLKFPIILKKETVFKIDSLESDTTDEIVNELIREKLFKNKLINGLHEANSHRKIERLSHSEIQDFRFEEYIKNNQLSVNNFRFFMKGRLDLYPNIHSVLISVHYENMGMCFVNKCELVMLNIDKFGQLKSSIILASYEKLQGLASSSEKISSRITSRKIFKLSYQSSIIPTDIIDSKLKPHIIKYSLRVKMTEDGYFTER